MVTSFVRINIVLILLRQALGSPQVPGNQVLTALAFLLTALVMRPVGEHVYHDAIVPYQTEEARRKGGVGGRLAADQGVDGPPDRQVQARRLPACIPGVRRAPQPGPSRVRRRRSSRISL